MRIRGRDTIVAVLLAAGLAGGLAGCQEVRDAEDPFSSVTSPGAGATATDGNQSGEEAGQGTISPDDDDTSGATEATAADDGEAPVFDLPPGGGEGDDPTPQDDACTKVDLLFVIDNSESMSGEQANLVASFPGFIDAMQQTLGDTDSYHIGVTTTDANGGNSPGCQGDGTLVTATSGTNASNQACGPYLEGAYMTDLDDLDASFPCAAQVGTGGIPFERPMDTLRAAIGPSHQGAGGCNEGFIRDDALLVAVIITDEEDHLQSQVIQNGSEGEPPDWFSDVVALKGGIEENIVVLSLVGTPGPNQCPVEGGEHEGAEVAARLIEFTNMFTHGTVGDVCAPSYDGFFLDAISVIDVACDGFVPAG
jgi:hypothetical protein